MSIPGCSSFDFMQKPGKGETLMVTFEVEEAMSIGPWITRSVNFFTVPPWTRTNKNEKTNQSSFHVSGVGHLAQQVSVSLFDFPVIV